MKEAMLKIGMKKKLQDKGKKDIKFANNSQSVNPNESFNMNSTSVTKFDNNVY